MGFFSWRKKVKPNGEEASVSFFDHLEELRWHLFRSVVAILIVGIALFIYRKEAIGIFLTIPFDGDWFPYQVLCKYFSSEFCFDKIQVLEIWNAPYEPILSAITFAFFGGMIVAFPYVVWEIWTFVKPALSKKEIRKVRWNVVTVSLLFFIGASFGYFIILPFAIKFLESFVFVEHAENMWRAGKTLNFVLMVIFGAGITFQMPIVMYYLAKIGLVSSDFLRRYRRHAIIVLLILAAFITPPDPFTQILIFIPLIFLYEIGIRIAKRVERKKQREEEKETFIQRPRELPPENK